MRKKLAIVCLLFISALALLSGCSGNPPQQETITKKSLSVYEPPVFQVADDDVILREGPGKNYKKIINQKATEALKETHYCQLDRSLKFVLTDSVAGWRKIKVTDPSWLSESHIGWIPDEHIFKEGGHPKKPAAPAKIQAFNDVSSLAASLSKNGIGQLKEWRNEDGLGYFSVTEYFRIGNSGTNNLDNNLAYYLESENEAYVEKLELVLNINNKIDRPAALKLFSTVSEKTFKSVKLPEPSTLKSSILSAVTFSKNTGHAEISLQREKNNIETWKLVIISKK